MHSLKNRNPAPSVQSSCFLRIAASALPTCSSEAAIWISASYSENPGAQRLKFLAQGPGKLDHTQVCTEANWSLQNIKFGLVDGALLIKHEAPVWTLSVDYFDEVITSIYAASIFALNNLSLLSSNEEPSQSGNGTGPRALKEDISMRSRTTAHTRKMARFR